LLSHGAEFLRAKPGRVRYGEIDHNKLIKNIMLAILKFKENKLIYYNSK